MSHLPDFDRVTYVAGVRRCRGILPTGFTCHRDHRKGEASVYTVHWSDRAPTRKGIRRYLLLAAIARYPTLYIVPRWQRVWRSNVFAYSVAEELHIVLPKSLADMDRAIVRADLAKVDPGEQGREEALAWSRR